MKLSALALLVVSGFAGGAFAQTVGGSFMAIATNYAAIAFSGSANDLISGIVPVARMPGYSGDCAANAGTTVMGCQRQAFTVGTLPSCNGSLRGQGYLVTNALVPVALAVVAGGGLVTIGVMCDGSGWIVQ